MIIHGDCRERLGDIPDNSVDSVVTDPPYELGFMGKKWDGTGIAYSVEMWSEVLRVLKPGGHLLAFGGTRTYHRMACAIEDAGFQIRDQIQWLYGSGFPKSYNIGKGIDKKLGNDREDLGKHPNARETLGNIQICKKNGSGRLTKGTSEWEGWGTALKPANEPICLARAPLSEKTIVENVLKWGTAGINVDGCRVGEDEITITGNGGGKYYDGMKSAYPVGDGIERKRSGRFPANLILDEEAGRMLGEPSRFFYCAKSSRKERNAGLEGMKEKNAYERDGRKSVNVTNRLDGSVRNEARSANHHPTVKPISLMRYLCRLITPPNGTVLDPFMGSGTTGCACVMEGFDFIGIEREAEYLEIAERRIEYWSEEAKQEQPTLWENR